jgi:hypothetical protein
LDDTAEEVADEGVVFDEPGVPLGRARVDRDDRFVAFPSSLVIGVLFAIEFMGFPLVMEFIGLRFALESALPVDSSGVGLELAAVTSSPIDCTGWLINFAGTVIESVGMVI